MEGLSLLSVIAYSELLGLGIALACQHIYATSFYIKKDIVSTNKTIFAVYASYLTIFISELLSGLTPYIAPDLIFLNGWAQALCYSATIIAPATWFIFCDHELSTNLIKNRFLTALFFAPVVAIIILSFSSVYNQLVFSIDSNGFYHKGPLASAIMLTAVLYYGLSLIFAFAVLASKEGQKYKRKCVMFICFAFPIIASIILHIFVNEGAASIGYIFSLCTTFSYLVLASNFDNKIEMNKKQYYEIIQSDREKLEKFEYERLNDSIIQARNAQVLRSLSEDFIFVCYVNLTTSEITRYHESPEIASIFDEFPSNMFSFEKMELFLRRVIMPSDYKKLHNCILNPTAVTELLKEGQTTEEFQANFDGKYKYYRLKLAVDIDNPNGVIYGIYSIDDYMSQKLKYEKARKDLRAQVQKARNNAVFETLSRDYEYVSYIPLTGNADNDRVSIYRDSDFLMKNVPGWEGERNFVKKSQALARMITSEKERNEFLQKTDRSTVMLQFLTEDSYDVDFCMTFEDGRHYYQIKATCERKKDGVVASVVVALRNMDDIVKSQNEIIRLEKEHVEQQAFTNLFIDTYTAAYYVNLKDYTYVQYKLKDSLKDRFTAYSDFVRTIANYIENNVYDEDRALMYESTNPDFIREKLEGSEQYTAVYRDKMGDEPSYRNMIITKGHDKDHVAVGFIDVSEQFIREKEIQENLKTYISTIEKQQIELEEANKAKTNFLFNMSHDIRTPMNAIIGYTDLAKEHIEERDRALQFLDKIALSGEHLLKLINEILDMSRIEGGKIHSELKTLDVIKSANKIADICKEEAISRKIDFTTDFEDIKNRIVNMDELHVNRVLLNVLSNAIKYTPNGGKVSFTIKEIDSNIPGYRHFEYTIADNGIGMSQDFLEHIFDSFSRERTSTVSGIQGTGLGMAIVKKLVDYMDGKISIESKVNEGTKVIIDFQFILPKSNSESLEESFASDGILSGRRVLFVEDNEINREIVRAILEEEGMIMHEAVNGKDAISVVEDKGIDYYDCILMDIQMPVMDGYETTEYLRSTYPNSTIPIIALSANAFEEDRRKALACGMNAHVAKPVSAVNLYRTLIKYIQNQE